MVKSSRNGGIHAAPKVSNQSVFYFTCMEFPVDAVCSLCLLRCVLCRNRTSLVVLIWNKAYFMCYQFSIVWQFLWPWLSSRWSFCQELVIILIRFIKVDCIHICKCSLWQNTGAEYVCSYASYVQLLFFLLSFIRAKLLLATSLRTNLPIS